MIRNQFSGESAKDFARELQDLYQAGRALSDISAPIELENYSNATIYSWLQSVSAAMAFFTLAASPVYRRIGASEIPSGVVKQAAEFFGDDAHDSSSPVGDETSLSTSDPTGEGSLQGAISAFERELLEGDTQEISGEEQ